MNLKQLTGQWRIIETDQWSSEDLDMLGPAQITFGRQGHGDLQMLAIEASIDYEISQRNGQPFVEFSWSGFDEGDPVSGRCWACIDSGLLSGRLLIHEGDKCSFVAKRQE